MCRSILALAVPNSTEPSSRKSIAKNGAEGEVDGRDKKKTTLLQAKGPNAIGAALARDRLLNVASPLRSYLGDRYKRGLDLDGWSLNNETEKKEYWSSLDGNKIYRED